MTQDSAGTEYPERPLERYLPELKLVAQHLPFIGPGWAQYLDDIVARRRRRAAAVAASFAGESGGISVADLISQSSKNERLADMIADILETSTRTASERKLRALGRALYLGYIAADDAALDEVELMLNTIRDLEGPHIKVLDHLIRQAVDTLKVHKLMGTMEWVAVPAEEVKALFPNGQTALYYIMPTLESHGLAEPAGSANIRPPEKWRATTYGLLLHGKLLEEGAKQEGAKQEGRGTGNDASPGDTIGSSPQRRRKAKNAKMPPEQEAQYALDFGIARSVLPVEARFAYDRLVEQRKRAATHAQAAQQRTEPPANPL